MRPPGRSLRISGGDILLANLWLNPRQLEALQAHHAAALTADPARAAHHAAWLSDLARAAVDRRNHHRASQPLAPLLPSREKGPVGRPS